MDSTLLRGVRRLATRLRTLGSRDNDPLAARQRSSAREPDVPSWRSSTSGPDGRLAGQHRSHSVRSSTERSLSARAGLVNETPSEERVVIMIDSTTGAVTACGALHATMKLASRPPAAPTGPRQAPASPPAWPADHRSSSVLAFLCSCFPEGLGGPAGERCSPSPRGSVNRWGNRRLPAPQDPSCSPL